MFVLAAHSALSLLLPNYSYVNGQWGFNRRTDDTEQLYIDGMTVGRGWNQLYVYGNALWDNKFEIRMPIIKEAVWLTGFFDAAALLDEPWRSLNNTPGNEPRHAQHRRFPFLLRVRRQVHHPAVPPALLPGEGVPDPQRTGGVAERQPEPRRMDRQFRHLSRWRHLLGGRPMKYLLCACVACLALLAPVGTDAAGDESGDL